MKIAISSCGKSLQDQIDPRFGRARYFILFNTLTNEFQLIENTPNVDAPSGAGIQSASLVVNHGAEAVITSNCGPKAFAVLKQANVQLYIVPSGTVREAIDSLQAGSLVPTPTPNVEGHW